MRYEELEASLADDTPPSGMTPELTALWHERKGNWRLAHELVQDRTTREAAAVHAYLHRREGDIGNAAYWYRRARRDVPQRESLEEEWSTLARELIEEGG